MVEESIKKGYQKTEVGIIPEDWDLEKINKVSIKLLSGGTPSTTNPEYWNGDIPWTRGAVLTQRYIDTGEHFISKNGLKNSASVLIPKHNLIVASRVSIGNLSINKIDIAINQDITGVIINKEKILVDYLYWYLFYFLNKIIAFSQGTSIQGFTRNELKEFLIALPSLPEQEKIVNILSNIDELIQQIDYLITKKKNIKQGIMQELLTGGKRLFGFIDEWETKELGKIVDIKKGQQLNKSNLTLKGSYPVWNGGIEPSGFTHMCNELENTITISEGGNSCGFVNFSFEKFWCGGHCYALNKPKLELSKTFLYYVLKMHEKSIMKLRVGSGLPNIQKKRITEFPIGLPPFQEQIAIAEILSDIDSEIKEFETKKDKYMMIKNGMIQKLLTGEIRLT